MKLLRLATIIFFSICSFSLNAQNILKKIKSKTTDRINTKVDNAIDKGLDKTEASMKTTAKDTAKNTTATTVTNVTTTASTDTSIPQGVSQNMKVFQNYDFVPGDTIVFEDHFTDDQNGEFPAHWNLGAGQGVMNSVGGQNSLLLTQGNYAHVSPLIKAPVYFSDAFTIEFDWYFNGGFGPKLYFYANSKDAKAATNDIGNLALGDGAYVTAGEVALSTIFPPELQPNANLNTWHHIAIAYKKNQMKIYVDQNRVLVVPNLGISPHAFDIEGIGDENNPMVISNFRVARGAGMNMLGKKFTDAKIITHGINFDVNKAIIKPESMGTLNGIVQILKDNPELKFEVGGHTDSDGDDALNLKLSQLRAEAVRGQLIAMGIAATRLTAKGFGKTKPIADNKTFEGKANNRRVEFVKI